MSRIADTPDVTRKSLAELFEQQVRRAPGAAAVISDEGVLTYDALNRRANRIAHALAARGVGPEVHVGLRLRRGAGAVVAVLAVLKAGGAYVPVDPGYPEERRRFIVEDSGMTVMLIDRRGDDDDELGVPLLALDDEQLARSSDRDALRTDGPERPDRLLYILYTSGSTGAPKGVCGTHGPTIHRFAWMWRTYPFQAGEVQAHRTTLNFVDSVWEMLGPLLAGVPLAVISPQDAGDPERLLAVCRDIGATRITVVPSLLRAVLSVCPRLSANLPAARLWVSSGERLTRALYEQFRAAAPDVLLLNLYGSTEVAGDVTCAALGPGVELDEDPPIGRPIGEARVLVLDDERRPVRSGDVGEAYVGGPVLARGYHRRPEEERARFSPDPTRAGERLFRTGDLVREGAAGELYYVGRADQQIKLRGVRIEPGEIERVLATYRHPVSAAAVVLQRGDAEGGRLCAFVAPASLDADDLRRHAAASLPMPMVPARIVPVDELPLTPNGKIDRRLLEQVSAWREEAVPEHLLPRTETERVVARVWAPRLEVWPIARDADFFALGGDSLAAVAILVELRRRFSLPAGSGGFSALSTIASTARWVDERRAGLVPPPPPATPGLKLVPLQAEHVEATARLAAAVFREREPLAACVEVSLAEFLPFCRTTVVACAAGGLSFVATRPAREDEAETVVGFCLAHDLARPVDAPIPPRLAPVLALLDELGRSYERHLGSAAVPGQVAELFMSGVARGVDGLTLVLALEQASLAAARERGYTRAMAICTHRVTAQLALEESEFRRIAAIRYATYQVAGAAIFAAADAVHREAVLVERIL